MEEMFLTPSLECREKNKVLPKKKIILLLC